MIKTVKISKTTAPKLKKAKKIEKVMREFKKGELNIGKGKKKVKKRKQAIAIAINESKKNK